MTEEIKPQPTPVKVYRDSDRLTVAAPMPGLEPEDVTVTITAEGRLVLHGELRGLLKGDKEVLADEWNPGPYHREITLPAAVDGELANVTYGNGVLVVALPVVEQTRPARLVLEEIGLAQGQRVGNAGHPVRPLTTAEHREAMKNRRPERRGHLGE